MPLRPVAFKVIAGERVDQSAFGGSALVQEFIGMDARPPSDGQESVADAQVMDGWRQLTNVNLSDTSLDGTMKLVAFKFPDVQGNVIAAVREGSGDAKSNEYGQQGVCASVYNETWGGRAPGPVPQVPPAAFPEPADDPTAFVLFVEDVP